MVAFIAFLKRNWQIFLIVFVSFVLRIIFLEKWMGDWDSIQLALGLNEFSIVKHQPHPPGYPIYILIGKFFRLFSSNDTQALTWMSSVFGSLTIFPLYFIAKQLFDKQVSFSAKNKKWALFASFLFIFTPVVWLLSVTALTDIVGLFFLVLIAYLFFRYIKSKKVIILVSLLAGVSIGARFNEFPIILGLLFWVMVKQRILRFALLQLLALILGVCLWLIPMILLTGWNEFFQAFSEIGRYVVSHDVLLGENRTIQGIIKSKILMLINLFNLGFSLPLSLAFFTILIWTFFQKKLFFQEWYQVCLIWLISYFALLLTFYNLELPRHILPLCLPIIFVTTYGFKKLTQKNRLFLLLPVFLIILVTIQSYSQVSRFHNSIPATVSPILFVKQNFNPDEVVIYSSHTYRNFTYYAGEYKNIDNKSDKSVITPDKIIILDHVDLKKDPMLSGFEEVDTHYFSSDKDIFPKVDTVQLHILKYKDIK
jgi:hypothetical protein